MLDSMTVRAPAKINIGLRVLPRRADGYHDIESIFTTVRLWDTLTVSLTTEKGSCIVECDAMKLPPDNTVVRAYKAFCVLTGADCGVHVSMKKRIPAGGGLGGGSSDASSFIQSIDALCGTQLQGSDMTAIAGQVGSDVYFFTQALLAQTDPFGAVVTGRGEKMAPIAVRNDYAVVLVFPDVRVSTRDAYAWIDEDMSQEQVPLQMRGCISVGELQAEYARPMPEWRFKNDFTAAIGKRYGEIGRAIADMRRCGADFADMSGSGSTVFGLFPKSRVQGALEALSGKWQALLA